MSTIELTNKAREYRELQVLIKQLEDEAEAIKAAITAEMEAQSADTLQVDIFTIRFTAYQSSRIDVAALKKELPDIAARFTKTTEAQRFQIA